MLSQKLKYVHAFEVGSSVDPPLSEEVTFWEFPTIPEVYVVKSS
jgi:hypothetical protein